MQDFVSKVKEFLEAGFTSALCRSHEDAMNTSNQRMLRLTGSFVSTCCGIALLSSLLFDSANSFPLPVLIYLLLSLSLYSLIPHASAPPGRRSTVLLFCMVSISMIYGVVSALWLDPGHAPLQLCVLLAVAPVLFSAPFWMAILPGLVATVFFLLGSAQTCPPPVFLYDLKWTLCCFCVGVILGHHHAVTKVREFVLSEQLCQQRDTDSLTNLLTRGAAESRIRDLLELGDTPCTIFIMDIDNFKSMNDTYGHSYGDAILECLANLLRESFRTSDYVCRLGGDEFMVLIRGNAEPAVATAKAQKLLDDLAVTPTPDGKNLHPTISIGIALFPQHGTTFDELYRRADHALYTAKHSGKNTYQLFNT